MDLIPLDEMAARVPDGARLAVGKDDSGVAMAATIALMRRGVKNLHLVTVPVSGLQADLMIGSGCVATLETSGITLGEFGLAPCFTRAVKAGAIRLMDATCPAIYAALQAAQKGLPFMPLRGILETDLLVQRPDWKVIDNPFAAGDRIVALPAIAPDVALLHAPLGDRDGNVFIGRQRDLLLLAHASRTTLITVESITEDNLLQDEARSGSVIPALYVSAVAHAPRGAWPLAFGDAYGLDAAWMARYAAEAKSPAGFAAIARALMQGADAGRLAA